MVRGASIQIDRSIPAAAVMMDSRSMYLAVEVSTTDTAEMISPGIGHPFFSGSNIHTEQTIESSLGVMTLYPSLSI